MQHPKLYIAIQIPQKKSEFGPHNSAKVFCKVTVFVTSLQFAKITKELVINIKKTNCAIKAVATPPDLSNASGKFNKPAPSVALIIKNIVPINPIPKKYQLNKKKKIFCII